MKRVDREKERRQGVTLIRAITSTHSGRNVKMEDGGSSSLHVVLEKLHHCVWGDLWAMDGNGHMSGIHERVFCQFISHPGNEEGLPHARPSGADNPYTGAVCVCVCREREREREGIPKSHITMKICYSYFSQSTMEADTPCVTIIW